MQANQQLTFDRYTVDLSNTQLWRGTRRIALTSKTFAVLHYLLNRAGQLVTKAELFDALWPGTVVSDGALTFCIVELRKALGDNAKQPKFIETVHGRGYRFLPTVTAPPVLSHQSSVFSSDQAGKKSPQLTTDNCELTTLLVGREADLLQLHQWLGKALHGERQMVFVTGEPGIGKTTLIEAFRQRLETGGWRLVPSPQASSLKPLASRMWVAVGRCIEHYGPGEPYMPILEALGRLCREPDGEQLVTLLNHHAPTWLVQMPSLLTATELAALQRKTQGATRERMLREMGEAIEAITAEHPLVLWLEDLHWSDTSTLELLSVLARRRELARLLVIGTYRPVDVIVQKHPLRIVKQELQLHGLGAELPLGLLSEAQVAEYLAQRIEAERETERNQGRPLAAVRDVQEAMGMPQLARSIHRRTDGNPLFMVTLVNDLLSQRGLLRETQGATQPVASLLDTIQTRVPDTVQHLILQQLERLSTEERRVLEVASVVGMEFSAAAVAAGLTTEIETVEECCAGFAQHGRFLRAHGAADWPDGTVAARYSFLHALYQEVLYARIPAARRRRLHQRIGEREEHAYGEHVPEIAAELAVHFEQGRDYGKAVQYLQQAGEKAMRRSAYGEAGRLLTKGLEVLKHLPASAERNKQELWLHFRLGESVIALQGYAAADLERLYTRALELCHQIGETPQRFGALLGLSGFFCVRGPLATARELGEQLVQL
ncbi:MAG: AAA family ATPase, partial [Deltaproteobacteria bacterium]|nr:AAA family ATPase [Deltaproteobacteria bacterium]